MFKAVMAIVLASVLFFGLMQFTMSRQADQFMTRVQREVLETFDRRAGLDSVREPIMRIAKAENIDLTQDNIEVRIGTTNTLGAAAAMGVAAPDSGGEALEVTASFELNRFIFSKSCTRTARKFLKGTSAGAHSYSSGGFTGGVNVSSPSRDVNSHRQSVGRAVSGQNE